MLYVESKADGSGDQIDSISLGLTFPDLDLYAVERAESNTENVPATWSMTGNIGVLSILEGGKSAKFSPTSVGDGVITVTYGSSSKNLQINVFDDESPEVSFESASSYAFEKSTEWHKDGWSKRIKLEFKNATRPSHLVDFPVLVRLNSSRINYYQLQSNGEDLRFVDTDGAELSYEIEKWNPSGDSIIWVKVPQVDASSDTDFIWLYYQNSTVGDAQNPTTVWADYSAVWHFDTGSTLDSTVNGNHGTNQGSSSIAGIIGEGQSFDGSSDYIQVSNSSSLELTGSAITISGWMNQIPGFGSDYAMICKGPSTNNETYMLGASSGGSLFNLRATTSSGYDRIDVGSPSPGNWYHVVGVYDGNEMRIYANGILVDSGIKTGNIVSDSSDLFIGKRCSGDNRFFPGTMDELRIHANALSSDWISAQFDSQTDGFLIYNEPETRRILNFDPAIVLSEAWAEDVQVDFTVSGTSTPLVDHLLVSGQVVIPAGDSSVKLPLQIVEDLTVEGPETIVITLSDPVNSRLGSTIETTIQIVDENAPPDIEITLSSESTGQRHSSNTMTPSITLQLTDPAAVTDRLEYRVYEDGSLTEILPWTTGLIGTPFSVNALSLTNLQTYHIEARVIDDLGGTIPTIVGKSWIVDTSPNTAPTGLDDEINIYHGGLTTIDVLANDTDAQGHPLSLVSVTQGTSGSVVIVEGEIRYFPLDTFGVDTFTYTVADIWGATDTATVTVNKFNRFTWTGGGGDGDWTNNANWCGSFSSGNCQEDLSPPGISDVAIFDATCTINCDVDIGSNLVVGGIRLYSGYSGTITQLSGVTIDIGTSSYFQEGGTFVGGDSDFTLDSYATSKMSVLGGSFTATSADTFIRYGLEIDGTQATFNHNGGRLNLGSDCGCSVPGRNLLKSPNVEFYNVILSRHGGADLDGETLIILNNLEVNVDSGGLTLTNGTIQLGGNLNIVDASGGVGDDTVELVFNGSGTQAVSVGPVDTRFYFDVSVDKPSGTVQLLSNFDLTIGGTTTDFHIINGTLDLNGFTLSVSDDIFLETGGTLDVNGGSHTPLYGSADFIDNGGNYLP